MFIFELSSKSAPGELLTKLSTGVFTISVVYVFDEGCGHTSSAIISLCFLGLPGLVSMRAESDDSLSKITSSYYPLLVLTVNFEITEGFGLEHLDFDMDLATRAKNLTLSEKLKEVELNFVGFYFC